MNILIVKSAQESSWISCQSLISNLLQAFRKLDKNITIEIFSYTENIETSVGALQETIHNKQFDQLVFIDHGHALIQIIQRFLDQSPLTHIPPITFVLYGDFQCYSKQWAEIGEKLLHHQVKFITASKAHAELINYFCMQNNIIHTLPFPLDVNEFFFSQKERDELRNSLQIKESTKIFLYSGRLSLQKNIDVLLEEFANYKIRTKADAQLWLLGDFDNAGAEFTGKIICEGYYFNKIENILKKFPAEIRSSIHFKGMIEKNELRSHYCAADVFISLSLHHDEDYGLAVAEALSCGLPCIVTAWGGLRDFQTGKDHEWNCQLIDLDMATLGFNLDISALQFQMESAGNSPLQRNNFSKNFQKKYSFDAISGQLEQILQRPYVPFEGFKWMIDIYPSRQKIRFERKNELIRTMVPGKGHFYEEIYSHYIDKNKNLVGKNIRNIHWMIDFFINENLLNSMGSDKKSEVLSDPYFSSAKLCFTSYLKSNESAESDLFIRDGFKLNGKKPEELLNLTENRRVVLHRNFLNHLDRETQELFTYYQIKSYQDFKPEFCPEQILISFISPVDDKTLTNLMDELKDYFGEKILSSQFFFYSNLESHLSVVKQNQAIKNFKLISDITMIKFSYHFKNCLYVELNNNEDISDTSIMHLALSKGCVLWKGKDQLVNENIINQIKLSPFHYLEHFRRF